MFVMQVVVYILLMLLTMGIYSCIKKILEDVESMRIQHRHSFYNYDE